MKSHKVSIQMTAEGRLNTEPKRLIASAGDTIQWSSPDGEVVLHFKPGDTPFDTHIVRGGEPHTAMRKGTFPYRCTLKKKDSEQVIDWPDDGADVEISNRGN